MQQTRFKFQIPHKWRCIPNKETPVAEAEAGLGCHLCPGLRVSLVENCNSPYSDWTEEKDLSCLLCFLDVVAALWDTCFSFCLAIWGNGAVTQASVKTAQAFRVPQIFLWAGETFAAMPLLSSELAVHQVRLSIPAARVGLAEPLNCCWPRGIVVLGQPKELKQAEKDRPFLDIIF